MRRSSASQPARFAFLDSPRPLAFAHRGADIDGLENSLRSFESVLKLGYRYLETDVRSTSDGAAVVFHDKSLDRVTDQRGQLARLDWATVSRARIGGREPIPLLEDLLGSFPEARVNIDVKTRGAILPTVQAIKRTRSLDRVCVASFSDYRVNAVRSVLGPQLCTSFAPRGAFALWRASRAGRLSSWPHFPIPAGVPCAQLPPTISGISVVDERLVAAAHDRGIQVHVWTLNDRMSMENFLAMGVDGIVTDEAELLREVLQQRGQWPA